MDKYNGQFVNRGRNVDGAMSTEKAYSNIKTTHWIRKANLILNINFIIHSWYIKCLTINQLSQNTNAPESQGWLSHYVLVSCNKFILKNDSINSRIV